MLATNADLLLATSQEPCLRESSVDRMNRALFVPDIESPHLAQSVMQRLRKHEEIPNETASAKFDRRQSR
jgi:hypothetical protein